jgi:hypothetical protein
MCADMHGRHKTRGAHDDSYEINTRDGFAQRMRALAPLTLRANMPQSHTHAEQSGTSSQCHSGICPNAHARPLNQYTRQLTLLCVTGEICFLLAASSAQSRARYDTEVSTLCTCTTHKSAAVQLMDRVVSCAPAALLLK